MRADDLGAPKM